MNPNSSQALEDEEAGMEEEAEDIDYDALYGGLDIDATPPPKTPEMENSYRKIFGDIVKQYAKETLIGAGGTWGDLAELAGLSQEQPAAERQKNFAQHSTLQAMNEPGYKPSIYDIASLTNDDELPGGRLPTSKSLGALNEAIGGPGEPETPQGKYAARAGKLTGAGLAFGQVNPLPAIAGGVAGQGVEDAGGGVLAQTAAEIVTLLLTQGRSKRLQSSTKQEVQDKINHLRQLGYAEEDITLAINSANNGGKTAKIASKGSNTEQAFENFAEHSDQIVSDILTSEIPGIERGTQHVHQMASDAYGAVAQEAANLTITNSRPFLDAARRVVDELQRNLGRNPEAQGFIQRLSDAAIHSTQYPTAESFMNFYKELNAAGKWMGRSQKDRLINQVKDGIKDTFRSEGRAGRDLANRFEEVNAGVRRAYQAEEVHNLIQKTATQDGIDYKKLYKVFDKPENVHLMEDVLGATQTNNLRMVAKTGKEIKDFDKAWKVANNFRLGTAADIGRGAIGSYYLYQGDWEGLAKVVATKGGTAMVKKLAEKSLTDPRFQNLIIKGLHAIKNASPRAMKATDEAMKKYLEEEGIDIDLD